MRVSIRQSGRRNCSGNALLLILGLLMILAILMMENQTTERALRKHLDWIERSQIRRLQAVSEHRHPASESRR